MALSLLKGISLASRGAIDLDPFFLLDNYKLLIIDVGNFEKLHLGRLKMNFFEIRHFALNDYPLKMVIARPLGAYVIDPVPFSTARVLQDVDVMY